MNKNTTYPDETYQRERPGRPPDNYESAYPMGMASDTRRGPDERMPADMRPGDARTEYDVDPWRYEGGQPDRGQRGRPSERGLHTRSNERPRVAEPRQYHQQRRERSFRGVGPRNYRRSDDRIREDICDALTDNAFIDASDIDISVNNSEVTLEGTVESRRMKHLAEDIADDCPGVTDVHNRIKVASRRVGSNRNAYSSTAGTSEEPEGNGSSHRNQKYSSEASRDR